MVFYSPGRTSSYPEQPPTKGYRYHYLGGGNEVGNVGVVIEDHKQTRLLLDYGLAPTEDLISGIPPSENNWIIDLDENESVTGFGPNVAVVIPQVQSSSFVEPIINIDNE